MITRTHTRTYTETTFADPYKKCLQCGAWITGVLDTTAKRPRLHPSHQHQWEPIPGQPMVRCTVCGFEAPRRLSNLDGSPAEPKESA